MRRYRLLLWLLSPVFLLLVFRHYWQYKDTRYLWQRLGLKLPELDRVLWIHCASVGEVITVSPLIKLLKQHHADRTLLITTNTITGARVVAKNLPGVQHCYLSLDFVSGVRRFFRHIKPMYGLVVETELWPNLFQAAQQHNIPISLINARLSTRTTRASRWMKKVYSVTLNRLDKILCRSDADLQAYLTLGASTQQTELVGNLKFAAPNETAATKNPITRPYVLAASTHDDEEQQLCRMWQKMPHGDYVLVIAPRHPERRDAIINAITQYTTQLTIRSHNDAIDMSTDVYLADTLGELMMFIEHAEVVIMGGSFIPHGGHNLLEPARAGKAILYGPSMHNFAAENELFLQHQAAIQVADIQQLQQQLTELLTNKTARQTLGHNAKALVEQHSDIALRYAECINQLL